MTLFSRAGLVDEVFDPDEGVWESGGGGFALLEDGFGVVAEEVGLAIDFELLLRDVEDPDFFDAGAGVEREFGGLVVGEAGVGDLDEEEDVFWGGVGGGVVVFGGAQEHQIRFGLIVLVDAQWALAGDEPAAFGKA